MRPPIRVILLFSLLIATKMQAQNSVNIALADTSQMKKAIVALRQYNPHVGQLSWTSTPSNGAYEMSFRMLADALELSLQFKATHILTAEGASLIRVALREKKERDDYAASPQGIQEKYNIEHPTYTRRDGSRCEPSGTMDIGYGSNGYDSYVFFSVKGKPVTFKKISPGVYQEQKK